jgi:hypothetical protein
MHESPSNHTSQRRTVIRGFMTYSSWPRLSKIYRELAVGEIKLIGWGAGHQLRQHYLTDPCPLSYVIDSDPTRIGERFLGCDVRPPEALLEEDPAAVAVMVGPTRTARVPIARQIAALGPFDIITPYDAELAERFCLTLDRADAAGLTRKPKATTSRNGIVVQGPYDPGATASVLRILATHYPDDFIVWSTWEDTPLEVLDELGRWCDGVVLSRPPAYAGNVNINLQRRTVLAGLDWLRDRGVELAMKVRSDAVPLARNLFAQAKALYQISGPPSAGGKLKRRIIVSHLHTLLHLPLHISDIFHLGDIEDLQRLWSFAEDTAPVRDTGALDMLLLSVADYSATRTTGETFIGHQLADLLGIEIDYSLPQYLDMVRDALIVPDPAWFDIFKSKYNVGHHSLFLRTAERPKSQIDFEIWMGLQARDPGYVAQLMGGVDVRRTTVLDLQFGEREAAARAARAGR